MLYRFDLIFTRSATLRLVVVIGLLPAVTSNVSQNNFVSIIVKEISTTPSVLQYMVIWFTADLA